MFRFSQKTEHTLQKSEQKERNTSRALGNRNNVPFRFLFRFDLLMFRFEFRKTKPERHQ